MDKILITGGAGFIGSNLALKLTDIGYNVTVLDNLSEQVHGHDAERTSPLFLSIKNRVNFIKGDVTKRSDWELALNGQDKVVHLAAETGTGQSMYQIEKYVNVNIAGTALLLDIIANNKYDIGKIILASSRAIYGEGKYYCEIHGDVYPEVRKESDLLKGDFECKCPVCMNHVKLLPTTEDSMIHPTSMYGITKQTQEEMIMTIGKALQIPVVALRYQNVYGPGQSLTNPYTGILSIFSTQIRNGNNINIFEDGLESRDFVYIDDVVRATILAIENQAADYEVFNVGADIPIDVLTVAKKLIQCYNSNVTITITGKFRTGDIRHNLADLSKISRELNYRPLYDFERGINIFTDWVKSQEINEDYYTHSINELKKKGLFK
jgi:dTDP-L-rhamnose 4-epimerase